MRDLNDPTNRDSVPAMLTPGEFVLNKEASIMFGPQIEAMNKAGLQQRDAENRNMGGVIPSVQYRGLGGWISNQVSKAGNAITGGTYDPYVTKQEIDSFTGSRGEDGYNSRGTAIEDAKKQKSAEIKGAREAKIRWKGFEPSSWVSELSKSEIHELWKDKNWDTLNATQQKDLREFQDWNSDKLYYPNAFNTGGLVTFLKDKEGYKDNAYQDSAGVWTIGYGRTGGVKSGDKTDRATEDQWLDGRAAEELAAVKAFGKQHGYEWNDGQLNALASFRYNGGQGMIDNLTDFGKRDNATIQKSFGKYNKVTNPDTGEKEFVQGLQNRRDAELGLWGGTTPTQTPAAEPSGASPETTQAIQGFPENVADAATDALPGLISQAVQPQQMAPPPAMMAPPPAAAEYIPSVTQGNLPTSQPLPTEESNPMQRNQLWNTGGPVQYLRGGGSVKEKVWDSATQKYIFVDPSDPRVEQERALAAQAPAGKPRTPLAFAQASKPDVSHLGPRQYKAPYQQLSNLPNNGLMQFDRAPSGIPPLDPWQTSTPGLPPQLPQEFQTGPAASGNPHQPQLPPQVPANLPPVPGSDEALLQGGSQQIEQQEISAPPQVNQVPPQSPAQAAEQERLRQNALLGDQAKQFAKGDPRRAALFNQQAHQVGGVPGGPVAELPPSIPQAPAQVGSGAQHQRPQAPAQVGSGAQHQRTDVGVPEIGPQIQSEFDHILPTPTGELAGLSQEQIGQLYDQGNPAAIAYANQEDQAFNTNQALQQAQLQQSVTAPDAPAAEFIDHRVEALTDQLATLGTPPGGGGVGVDTVPASDPAITQSVPDLPLDINSVGGVPGIDIAAPTPEEVVSGEADYSGYGAAAGPNRRGKPVEKRATVANWIKSVDETEGPVAEVTNDQRTAIATQGETAMNAASPQEKAGVLDQVKGAFGDLFDGKELARMGILMLGAMATGMSPGRALAFAGQNYISRLDAKGAAKQKHHAKLVTDAKYTPSSISKYKESGDPQDLQAIDQASTFKELGNQKLFFDRSGRPIQAREVQTGDDSKHWIDGRGNKINLNTHHTDATRSPHTPEYRERVNTESKNYAGILKELQGRFGVTKGTDGEPDQYRTDITPEKSGRDIAKWAIENNVPVDGMGTLIDNAYAAARADSRDGKRAKSITPYLNDQYIQSQVGDTTLFQTSGGEAADPAKVNTLLGNISRATGLTGSTISNSTTILQKARPRWEALDSDDQVEYGRRAKPGQSGFMVWLEEQLATTVN